MKKSILFVSAVVGLGSLASIWNTLSSDSESKYVSREVVQNRTVSEYNDDYLTALRANVNTGTVNEADYYKAVDAVGSSRSGNAALGLNWEFSGPDNIGGRVRGIVVDKDNSDIIYAGGAAGGMFLSTDAAGSWTYKSDDWANIQVSTIAQDLDGRVYAGTGFYADAGAPGGGAFPGGGIWYSDDRGETWSHLASTTPSPYTPNDPWAYVNRIAIAQTKNSQGNYTVYAATSRGLKVSLDKGLTWIAPMTLPNCTNPLSGNVQDVVVTSTGRVLVSYSGSLYISDDGETVCSYTAVNNGMGNSSRMSLAVCSNDEDIVYAFQSYSGNPATFEIFSSADGGLTWETLSPAPPSTAIDTTFDLMGSNPANYNQAISVDPSNCDRIYVGAVEMYRVDGSWSSVAINFNAPGFYVHADKHWFAYDPKDPNIMYTATDGGVGKTTNSAAIQPTWSENNRHFGTTQYYGIAVSKEGQIVGGTQDNGTHLINPSAGGFAGKDGVEIFGGDGFDCQVSNISNLAFVSSQYGRVGRGTWSGGGTQGGIIQQSQEASGASPFHTILRFWESDDDITSKDSVLFKNSEINAPIGTGDGNKTLVAGTLVRTQKSAELVPGSVRIFDVGGGQEATDIDQPGVLKLFGDSVGTIDYATGDFDVRFSFPPPTGSTIGAEYSQKFVSGDTLELISQNAQFTFDYVLTQNLNVGDSVFVQDPVQSLLVVSMNGGINITREALYFPLGNPVWIGHAVPTPTCFEFSEDGNHLYVGSYNGTVTRVSGLNDLYTGVDPTTVLTNTTIVSGTGGVVSGLCAHPTDPQKLLVTVGGYGIPNHVYEVMNAESATGVATRRNIQGDLPDFPVYDGEYNVNKPEQVVLGTELGIWAAEDISGTNVTWTNESADLGNVPVFDVIQQRLPFNEASNYGKFYAGTFGRGIWTSGDLVSVNDNTEFDSKTELDQLAVYPNPAKDLANLTFKMPQNGEVNVSVYDITGKMVLVQNQFVSAGEAKLNFNVASLKAGTYFVRVQAGGSVKNTKFVVVK